MSLRKVLLFSLLFFITFSLGVTSTVLLSPGRSFRDALPHGPRFRLARNEWRGSGHYRRGCFRETPSADRQFASVLTYSNAVFDELSLDQLSERIEQMESQGRPFLGVSINNASGGVAIGPWAGWPADVAGLQQGDIVTRISGKELSDPQDLVREILLLQPGQSAILRINRDGESFETSVTPRMLPVDGMPMSHRALGRAYERSNRGSEANDQFRKSTAEWGFARIESKTIGHIEF